MPSLMASLGIGISGFIGGLNAAKGAAAASGKHIASSLGEHISGNLKALASVAALEELGRAALEYAGHVEDLSLRLGMSEEAVQAWDNALKLSGSSMDEASGFFEKLATNRKKALDGNDEMIASFAKFGVTVADLKTMRIEDIGLKISQAFSNGADPQTMIADLREIGGKGAGGMVAAFRDGLAEMVKENLEAGNLMSKATIKSLDATGDWFTKKWQEIRAQAGTDFAKPLAAFTDTIDSTKNFGPVLKELFSHGPLAARALGKKLEEERLAAKAEKPEKKKGGPGSGDDDPDGKKALHLLGDLQKKKDANALAEMTSEERITAMEQRRSDIKSKMSRMSKEGKIQAQIDMADLDKDIWNEGKGLASGRKVLHADANSLQKIGAYSSAPEMALIDVNRSQERHLDAIRKDIKRIADKAGIATGEGVMF